ncbi:MAG: ABC transporter ATP-binding protein [Bacillota bacterium]|nr:ABC transporter ATP-binding protein [Bacillota bacterium]
MLEIMNLKKYFNQTKAVDDISFKVEKGEILGLLGPNGAGKSTTISMIATLLKADKGKILYKGIDIEKEPKQIQKELGFVPQEIALYPSLSGYDNLKFWGRMYGLKGDKLKEKIEEVSQIIGIDKRLKNKVEEYSGGMKRRLNIGSALLHNPEILILDEPTVGIDPQSRKHILDSVKEINKKGSTVIYTSHYMEEVEYLCDKICIMDEGKIIAQGTKDDLIKSISAEEKVILQVDNINQKMIEEIKIIPYVDKIAFFENEITIQKTGNNVDYSEILEAISNNDGHLTSMDIKKPDLEFVFLSLTGRALRD